MRWFAEVAERLRALVQRERVDGETDEEMRFHLEMEAERRVREQGLDPREARRQAALAFGGLDRHREEVHEARGLGVLNGTSLDVKLGARMLLKYPGLTLAGGFSIAVAVALAVATFEFVTLMTSPSIPLADADRIVGVRTLDRAAGGPERRVLHDFEQWRSEVRTIAPLAAVALSDYGVTTEAGAFTSVGAARITASGLRLTQVQPRLGRLLVEADEQPGSPLVVVISHDLWREQFGSAPAVLGQTLRVGDTPATVVGVMPPGFGFPVNEDLWLPLREQASAYERRSGPAIQVFGRLAPGVTLAQAQAEMTTIAERTAAQEPATHEQLRLQVLRFVDAVAMPAMVNLMNLPLLLFLVVVCANVATLVFARTAARTGEIAVRSALGASRRRLVLQLVAESMVLTILAALLGLAAAQYGIRWGMALFWEVQQSKPPFWFEDGLSGRTVLYTIALTLLAATIIGGIPALKATGRNLRNQLVQPGTGAAGMRFGRVSTGVIVVQVALCVAFLPFATMVAYDLKPGQEIETRFPADDYLSARLIVHQAGALSGILPTDTAAPAATLAARAKQRIAEEPGVAGVAFTSRLPGFNHPNEPMQLEADSAEAYETRSLAVDRDWFGLIGARVIAGRGFRPDEYAAEVPVLLVDASWARTELPGRNPVGMRLRFPQRADTDSERWYEIVGVVGGAAAARGPGEAVAFYEPLRADDYAAVQVYVRTVPPPATLASQVHAAGVSIDPSLALNDVMPLLEVWRPVYRADIFFRAALHVVAFIILLFALIGIYALMSFTVAQRAREIAIRSALGAHPRQILASIFARAFRQIGFGVVLGATLVSLAIGKTPQGAALVAAVAALMLVMGLAGCVIPARRALRIQPTAAMKAE